MLEAKKGYKHEYLRYKYMHVLNRIWNAFPNNYKIGTASKETNI